MKAIKLYLTEAIINKDLTDNDIMPENISDEEIDKFLDPKTEYIL